jgi:uncharacterized linocin/CFP29 family protein
MAYDTSPVPWTDEQWARVEDTIQQEAARARVAATFLPLFGPLPPDTDFVRAETLREPPDVPRTTIVDKTTVQLATLQVKVRLRGAQLADPELASALQLFRRAANMLARLEDVVVFRGLEVPSEGAPAQLPAGVTGFVPADVGEIMGEEESDGLWSVAGASAQPITGATPQDRGEPLVGAVSASIGSLEDQGHFGPFAVVLGQGLFTAATWPSPGSLVLPQDRIIPFLGGGSFLRSSALEAETGVVVALGGAPVDLVVATDMSLNFLQVTDEPVFVFRVFEKIVLRIKQPKAIRGLELQSP